MKRVLAGKEEGESAAATAAGTDVRQSVLERSAQSSKREREPNEEAAEDAGEMGRCCGYERATVIGGGGGIMRESWLCMDNEDRSPARRAMGASMGTAAE